MFFVNGASYIALLAALVMMRNVDLPPGARRTTGLKDLVDGLKFARRNRDMFAILMLWSIYSLFGTAYITLLSSIVPTVYGRQAGEYGLMISAQGAGAFVAAFTIAATGRKGRPARRVVGGLTIFLAALSGLAFTRNYYLATALMAVLGFGMISFLVSGNILVQMLSPDAYRGRVMGIRTFVFGGLNPLGALMAGYIAKYAADPMWAVRIGGMVLLAGFVFYVPAILRARFDAGTAPEAENSIDAATPEPQAGAADGK